MSQKMGDKLREILKNKGVTLYRLSKISGVDYGHVNRIAHGKKLPSKIALTKLCQGLECSNEERTALFHAAGYLSPDEIIEC